MIMVCRDGLTLDQIHAMHLAIERIIRYAREREERMTRYKAVWDVKLREEKHAKWRRAGRTWRVA